MTDVIQLQEETIEHQTGSLLGNAGQGNRPAHVLCVGLVTLHRLLDGEAVWIEAAQAGAVAADDLFEFKQVLLQFDKLGVALKDCQIFSKTSERSHQLVLEFPSMEAMQEARDAIIKASVPEVRKFAASSSLTTSPGG